MFSFASKNKKLLCGLGIALSGMGAYYKFQKSQNFMNFTNVYCDSRYKSKSKQYRKYLEEFEKKVKHLEEDRKDDWQFYFEKNGCVVERLVLDGSDFYMIRGCVKTKSKKSLKEIMVSLNEASYMESKRHIYERVDPDNVYFKVIETLKKGKMFLCHARWTAHSWIVSDRDFILVRNVKVKKKEGLLYGGSIDHFPEELKINEDNKFYPVDDECVRGDLTVFYWKVDKVEEAEDGGKGGEYTVRYVTHIDPKGHIPTVIYNMVSTNQAYGVLMNAKESLEEEDREMEDNM